MRIHQVNSLPIHEVIQDISKAFSTNYYSKCDYYTVELPENVGRGVIEGISLGNGLGVIHYRCLFNEKTVIKFDLSEVHPLKFIFCYQGSVTHKFQTEDVPHEINYLQNVIVASKQHNGHQLHFEAGVQINIFSLEVARKDYSLIVDCDLKELNKEIEILFRDIHGHNKFYYSGYYSLKIAMLIKDINEANEEGFLKKIFFHSKALQFLMEQINMFENAQKNESAQKFLGIYEIEQIAKLAALIKNNLARAYTINELTQEVGLNKNKLQQGFKILFNTTINHFVKAQRILKAAELLTNTNLNISEITEQIGIKSKSYFSKTFKKEFGITPQEFRIKRGNVLHRLK